ncbi:sensor histidine kinase [Natronincola ferrireducens]|uniref:histidine kinase n=1 Tax=Natronincola ferrireducens TaxID=393762 RepID=A0A1G9F462_9FIRM|nr:HAMP domain-containing sensor histidine kinase [Natronincola ferrireducens]SDK83138.1 Signal transduction histidine kinase [Natronincola ferrireducens]
MELTKELLHYNKEAAINGMEDVSTISFLNALEEFVIIIDPDNHKIVFANDYAKRQNPNLEGNCCWEGLGYHQSCCYNKGCLYSNTIEVESHNGRWNEHRIAGIKLPKKTLVMETIIDITAKKNKDKGKNTKGNLLSMVSHELRTPLNIILSTIQLLEAYNKDWNSSKNLKHTQRIKRATEQINKLLRDILLVEKMEAHKIKFTPKKIDVVNLTKSTIELLRENMKEYVEINLVTPKEAFVVKVDEFIITTILMNLITNAIKYSKEKKDIKVQLDFIQNRMLFKIIDKGIGIPVEEQKNLFKRFYRASNAEKISGTGLGLAIVKELVELHKGSISFISKQNEGTTFMIEIPTDI